jgi:hypothetical protein
VVVGPFRPDTPAEFGANAEATDDPDIFKEPKDTIKGPKI